MLEPFREDVERGVEAIVLVTPKTGPLEHLQSALDARHRRAPRGLSAGEQDSLAAFDQAVGHWPLDLRDRLVASLRCLFLDDEADNGLSGLLSAVVAPAQNAETAGLALRALTTREAARRLGGSMEWWANELAQRGVELLATTLNPKSGTRSAPGTEAIRPQGTLGTAPFPPAHFLGRTDSVRRITAALRSGHGRAAIVGMGGVGKTALALKVAEVCQAHFAGGVLWADVGVYRGGIPEVLRMWLRTLGRDSTGTEFAEQLGCLRIALTEHVKRVGRILLVLDDTNERTAHDLVTMSSYLPQGVSILTTTREGTVGAAIGAIHFNLDPLERAQAVELLESISASPLVRAEEVAVDRLLSLLGDLPLAIELVGRQIAVRERKSTFTIEWLVGRLSAFNPGMLSFPGHRGVALSFALSYESLSEAEQLLFRGTGHFETTVLDSASVAAVSAFNEEDAEGCLERLVLVSMLTWGGLAGEYKLHPLLHKYAGFLLAHSPDEERQLGESRFVGHYAAVASTLTKDRPEDLAAIDRISANLIKAVRLASATGAHTVVSDLVFNLCVDARYFTHRNLDRDSIPVLEQAIAAARHLGDSYRESAFIGHLGSAHARLGANTQAVAHYEQAIRLARSTSNDYDLASHLQNLGTTLLSETQDLPRAERVLHEALTVAERSANVEALINTLNNLGLLHRETGNLSEARRLYAAALGASRLAGHRLSEGNSQSNLGLVISQMGDDNEAERMISEALAIAVEVGDKRGEGNRTGHLGNLLFARAQALPSGEKRLSLLARGRRYVENALRIAEETGDIEKAATWLMNLGLSSRLAGDDARGIDEIRRALAVAESGGFARLAAQAHYNLGFAMSQQRRIPEALRHLETASTLLRKMGSPMAAHAEAELRRVAVEIE